ERERPDTLFLGALISIVALASPKGAALSMVGTAISRGGPTGSAFCTLEAGGSSLAEAPSGLLIGPLPVFPGRGLEKWKAGIRNSGFFFSPSKVMDANFIRVSSTSNRWFLLPLYWWLQALARSMARRRNSSEARSAWDR